MSFLKEAEVEETDRHEKNPHENSLNINKLKTDLC